MGNRNGSLIAKALGLLIVAFVAIFVFKLILGAIAGILSFMFGVALLLVVGFFVIWALRKL
jgi:hypothetical protein